MKFSAKQVDEWVRLLGTLSAASASGAAVGIARPEQVQPMETVALSSFAVLLFSLVLYVRRAA